jgi:thioredoxin reductase (NADPH)
MFSTRRILRALRRPLYPGAKKVFAGQGDIRHITPLCCRELVLTDATTPAAEPNLAGAIATDALIVGAGPAGLFQVFELGLLGIKAHIVDSLPHPGGQCTELYPDKPIYDIPALPIVGAQELVDRLVQQAKPFGAEYHLGQEVSVLKVLADGSFYLETSTGTRFHAKNVVVAAGVGSFQPRRLGAAGADPFEGNQIQYKVKNAASYHGKHLAIFGGGDSALDWVMDFAGKAQSVTLIHRRAEFRGAPASANKVMELVAAKQVRFIEGVADAVIAEGDSFLGVRIKRNDGTADDVQADNAFVFYGLHPKLGPIAEWGLGLDKRAVTVDTEKFQSNIPGIFAIGDINTYPGKKKLILSGFHEAALAAFAIAGRLNPTKKVHLQYTTTSPVMQKRLGVAGA